MSEQYIPKVVPYIPNLEGVYKQYFYTLVSSWRHGDTQQKHIESLEKEIEKITQTGSKTEQCNRYKAVLLLLRDLLTTTWEAHFEYGQLMLCTSSDLDINRGNPVDIKKRFQNCMESSRLRVINDNRDFILKVESGQWTKQKAPISALMSDGKDLAKKLREVIDGENELQNVINPEIQLVDATQDETTGLRLLDIWRYFRYTWSSPAENTPGRSMQYLIRNKALPGHPIMGISSLDNCALALGPRDEFLGWSVDAFIRKLDEKGYSPEEIINLINGFLSDGISSINTKGFYLTARQMGHPTVDFIAKLRNSAQTSKDKRKESLAGEEFKANSDESINLLFLKKRKEKLASFLDARRQINECIESKGGIKNFTIDDFSSIYPAMTVALQAQKEKHIGSSMLELNVCGAIRPYNELLVGKLVALSALTPYVLNTYKERYKNRPSEIASQMLGEDVIRSSDLVYIGTTSLYSVGSSQYNRLVVPGEKISSSFDLRYVEMKKRTQGFGTFHISHQTTEAIETILSKNGSQTVNHQFGEGASPKLRMLGEGVRTLLKSDGNSSVGAFTTHSMPRIIYGASLISNLFEYLLGIDKTPKYYESRNRGKDGTEQIINFWMDRWLRKRLTYAPAIDRVASFDLNDDNNRYMVGKLLSEETEDVMQDNSETISSERQPNRVAGPKRIQFLRRFYKNSSSYSDSTELSTLKSIHVRTNLDDAILDVIKSGKDLVLTGNPGDGKTHLLRILEKEIKSIDNRIEPIYDASTLTTSTIARKWIEAKEKKVPFLIAINASVLYELTQLTDIDLPPAVNEAYMQFESGIVCGDIPNYDNHHVVVFNLGLRSALAPEVVSRVINQMADDGNFDSCKDQCPIYTECGFRKHAEIIRSQRFRERIQKVFHRIELVGQHITIRDLQAFFSYLIFWNHFCKNVVNESECDQYRIENLIYEKGRGNLFKAIRSVFDPAQISMPDLYEKLLLGDYSEDEWLPGASEALSAIEGMSLPDFNRRKRAFFFFHERGDCLLENRKRNSIAGFEEFLELPEKKQLRDIISKLRTFVGDRVSSDTSDTSFPVWRGFRFDNSPRRVIISMGMVSRQDFSIVVPRLLPSMEKALSTSKNYVWFRENRSGNYLKIDFPMFKLLEYSEQKVPIWALEENNYAKKIWRFMEDLTPSDKDNEDKRVTLCDLKRREKVSLEIETTDHRYIKIHKEVGV